MFAFIWFDDSCFRVYWLGWVCCGCAPLGCVLHVGSWYVGELTGLLAGCFAVVGCVWADLLFGLFGR